MQDARIYGDAPGVPFVHVELPRIRNNKMAGQPRIRVALLNGVNETIRKQHKGVPLAAMKIPRQIVAKADGAPDFTMNVDEKGNSSSMNSGERWLVLRATVDHPENASKDAFDNYYEGRRLLLAELIASRL